jgi:hypothetical protein
MIGAILIIFIVTLVLSLCFVLSGGYKRNNSQVQEIVDDVYDDLYYYSEDNKIFNVKKDK